MRRPREDSTSSLLPHPEEQDGTTAIRSDMSDEKENDGKEETSSEGSSVVKREKLEREIYELLDEIMVLLGTVSGGPIGKNETNTEESEVHQDEDDMMAKDHHQGVIEESAVDDDETESPRRHTEEAAVQKPKFESIGYRQGGWVDPQFLQYFQREAPGDEGCWDIEEDDKPGVPDANSEDLPDSEERPEIEMSLGDDLDHGEQIAKRKLDIVKYDGKVDTEFKEQTIGDNLRQNVDDDNLRQTDLVEQQINEEEKEKEETVQQIKKDLDEQETQEETDEQEEFHEHQEKPPIQQQYSYDEKRHSDSLESGRSLVAATAEHENMESVLRDTNNTWTSQELSGAEMSSDPEHSILFRLQTLYYVDQHGNRLLSDTNQQDESMSDERDCTYCNEQDKPRLSSGNVVNINDMPEAYQDERDKHPEESVSAYQENISFFDSSASLIEERHSDEVAENIVNEALEASDQSLMTVEMTKLNLDQQSILETSENTDHALTATEDLETLYSPYPKSETLDTRQFNIKVSGNSMNDGNDLLVPMETNDDIRKQEKEGTVIDQAEEEESEPDNYGRQEEEEKHLENKYAADDDCDDTSFEDAESDFMNPQHQARLQEEIASAISQEIVLMAEIEVAVEDLEDVKDSPTSPGDHDCLFDAFAGHQSSQYEVNEATIQEKDAEKRNLDCLTEAGDADQDYEVSSQDFSPSVLENNQARSWSQVASSYHCTTDIDSQSAYPNSNESCEEGEKEEESELNVFYEQTGTFYENSVSSEIFNTMSDDLAQLERPLGHDSNTSKPGQALQSLSDEDSGDFGEHITFTSPDINSTEKLAQGEAPGVPTTDIQPQEKQMNKELNTGDASFKESENEGDKGEEHFLNQDENGGVKDENIVTSHMATSKTTAPRAQLPSGKCHVPRDSDSQISTSDKEGCVEESRERTVMSKSKKRRLRKARVKAHYQSPNNSVGKRSDEDHNLEDFSRPKMPISDVNPTPDEYQDEQRDEGNEDDLGSKPDACNEKTRDELRPPTEELGQSGETESEFEVISVDESWEEETDSSLHGTSQEEDDFELVRKRCRSKAKSSMTEQDANEPRKSQSTEHTSVPHIAVLSDDDGDEESSEVSLCIGGREPHDEDEAVKSPDEILSCDEIEEPKNVSGSSLVEKPYGEMISDKSSSQLDIPGDTRRQTSRSSRSRSKSPGVHPPSLRRITGQAPKRKSRKNIVVVNNPMKF